MFGSKYQRVSESGRAANKKILCCGIFIATLLIVSIVLNVIGWTRLAKQQSSTTTAAATSGTPKNVILLIGDGMGPSYNTALRLYLNQTQTIFDQNLVGSVSTRSANSFVTDSAAGATAYSCALRTDNAYIGVDSSGNPCPTVLEMAKFLNKGTGLVSTSRVSHATPASFASHALIREWEDLIARQMGTMNENGTMLDVLLGGGLRNFQNASRKDGWDFPTLYQSLGWTTLVTTLSELESNISSPASLPLVGLFSSSHLPYYLDRKNSTQIPNLIEMSRAAIDLLSAKYSSEGFFLMIEGSRIDHCGHANDIPCLVNEMEEFDLTTQYVLQWARENGETLVVGVADHETGGMTLGMEVSTQTSSLENYLAGVLPANQEFTRYWGSYDLKPGVPPQDNAFGWSSVYGWKPDPIRKVRATLEKMMDDFESARNYSLTALLDTVSYGYGITLSAQETEFLNASLRRDPAFGYTNQTNLYLSSNGPVLSTSVGYIMSARTLTGWTTHGHTGADINLIAYGVGSEVFHGLLSNTDVGSLLVSAMGLGADHITEQTNRLRTAFESGALQICDPLNRLPFVGYNETVPYPPGNWLAGTGQMCVQQYV